VQADGPLRAYHWALKDYAALATPSQTGRFVHDRARLHLGYLAEASWAEARHMPHIWEYLVMRQFNNFRPCLSIVDAVDGYELPEAVYARPEIQRVTALACNATTIINDLYSFTKELASDPGHLTLPQVVAGNDQCGLRSAYLKSVEIHNEIMETFETESAVLSATSPLVERYARSLDDWADWSVLDETDPERRRERITRELHRVEQDQAELLASHLGPLTSEDRVFDAGCGRGGGSLVAHLRYGCHADGVTISAKQAEFANAQARKRGVDDKVRYHHRNMLDTGLPSGAYAASWNNESTMYVELDLLFAEHARLLRRGGRYVAITGCYNDTYGRASREVSLINAHYICDIIRGRRTSGP